MGVTIALLVYLVIAISQLRLRRQMQQQGRQPEIKMWLFPALTYAVIGFISICLVAMMFVAEYQVLVVSTGAATLVLMSMGIALQYKQRSKKTTWVTPLKPLRRSEQMHVGYSIYKNKL